MSHETETDIPCPGNAITVYAAPQVSGTGWILAVGDPSGTSGTGLHRLEPLRRWTGCPESWRGHGSAPPPRPAGMSA